VINPRQISEKLKLRSQKLRNPSTEIKNIAIYMENATMLLHSAKLFKTTRQTKVTSIKLKGITKKNLPSANDTILVPTRKNEKKIMPSPTSHMMTFL
jgi:hypothetical protein